MEMDASCPARFFVIYLLAFIIKKSYSISKYIINYDLYNFQIMEEAHVQGNGVRV